MYDFTYKKAGSIDDAIAAHGAADEARYMSGGMTLLPTLKLRLDKPSDVIDLAAIDGLAGINSGLGVFRNRSWTSWISACMRSSPW